MRPTHSCLGRGGEKNQRSLIERSRPEKALSGPAIGWTLPDECELNGSAKPSTNAAIAMAATSTNDTRNCRRAVSRSKTRVYAGSAVSSNLSTSDMFFFPSGHIDARSLPHAGQLFSPKPSRHGAAAYRSQQRLLAQRPIGSKSCVGLKKFHSFFTNRAQRLRFDSPHRFRQARDTNNFQGFPRIKNAASIPPSPLQMLRLS